MNGLTGHRIWHASHHRRSNPNMFLDHTLNLQRRNFVAATVDQIVQSTGQCDKAICTLFSLIACAKPIPPKHLLRQVRLIEITQHPIAGTDLKLLAFRVEPIVDPRHRSADRSSSVRKRIRWDDEIAGTGFGGAIEIPKLSVGPGSTDIPFDRCRQHLAAAQDLASKGRLSCLICYH